jgi:hypothetical protein
VFNDGTESAKFVRIEVLVLDSDRKLLDVEETYAGADVLLPGSSTRFDIQILSQTLPAASYELSVSARRAD